MIVGLIGRKMSGKSTVAKVFESKGYKRVSYAGPLKEIVSKTFGIPMFYFTDPEAKEKAQISLTLNGGAVLSLLKVAEDYYPIKMDQKANAMLKACDILCTTPRQLLQVVGTEVFRNTVDQDYWLKAFKASLNPNLNYICDDARFENEVDLIKSMGGKIIAIDSPGLNSNDTHASEQLPITGYDYKILNAYSVEDLRNEVLIIYNLMEMLHGQETKGTKRDRIPTSST